MFSARLPAVLAPNAVAVRLAELRASGVSIVDLTQTNPTVAGLPYPPELTDALASSDALVYVPEPFGLTTAREAVARSYGPAAAIRADRVMLTASTSEAYSFLFKLLCDAGDEVLVPQPSYPLFDLLSALDNVRAVPYRLTRHDGWSIERATVERSLSSSTRAILVVSPNNPTGSFLHAGDRDWLVRVAADRGLALISDEVFAPFPLSPRRDATSLLGEPRVLTFTLGGLSKSAALPQMKLAWTVVSGPQKDAAEALARLEIIADTYLSVASPVQLAARALITAGEAVRRALLLQVGENLAWLREHLRAHPPLTLLEPEGGWAAVLRVPAVDSEERIVLRLLDEARVLVHPGYFFDFHEEAFLVISLLPEASAFRDGVSRMTGLLGGSGS
jgi:aspartate/methionine/tyrosine aminotransferase